MFAVCRLYEHKAARKGGAFERGFEMKEKITCIVVDFERKPKVVKIEKSLEAYQNAVGGYIEVVYPFSDSVGIVCNEEGKSLGLPPNRALYMDGALRDHGELYDVIFGKFLIVGLTEEDFGDLSEDLQNKYLARFAAPEFFFNFGGDIRVFKGKTRLVSKL